MVPPVWRKYHFSLRAGPSGGPAIFGALADLRAAPHALREAIASVGGEEIRRKMDSLLEFSSTVLSDLSLRTVSPMKGVIRRVVGIPDREGKTRVIAIGDYWSQTALKPFHDLLFRILKRIPQDMTFHQGAFVDTMRKWGEGVTLYSVDLSSATDRFPIRVISDVLKGGFPDEFVEAWEHIMVGYPFQGPEGEVRYSVGNPMGLYSSWASFALAHHFVMFQCCQELSISWRRAKYVILGDDVLIGDSRLGELYQVRVKSLGIDVSPLKTFTSPLVCEFAKRYFFKGEEVTPFPVSAVEATLGDVSLLVSTIIGEERKGFFPRSGIPGAVKNLSKILHHRGVFARHRHLRAVDAEAATRLIQMTLDPAQFVLDVSQVTDPVFLDILPGIAGEILKEAVTDTIHDSLSRGAGSLDSRVRDDLVKILDQSHSLLVDPSPVLDIPFFCVYNDLEGVVSNIDFNVDQLLTEFSLVDLDLLSEVLVNPLRESSWGLDKRKRKVRAWSRVARACRTRMSSYLNLFSPNRAPSPPPPPVRPCGFFCRNLYLYHRLWAGRKGWDKTWMDMVGRPMSLDQDDRES
jgi:hypothetical protein